VYKYSQNRKYNDHRKQFVGKTDIDTQVGCKKIILMGPTEV